MEAISTKRTKIIKDDYKEEEELYIGTAESEHIEMYLKAIWYMHERGQDMPCPRTRSAQLPNCSMLHSPPLYKCFTS